MCSADSLDACKTLAAPLREHAWEGEMDRRSSASDGVNAALTAVDWMVTVTEPLPDCPSVQAGDEYVVKIGRSMKIRCSVLESWSPDASTGENDEMVFDAKGTALGRLRKTP